MAKFKVSKIKITTTPFITLKNKQLHQFIFSLKIKGLTDVSMEEQLTTSL